MAPTMNMTKPVTTAIATFVSIDKFIIFPFNLWRQPPVAPFFGFCFSYITSNFGVLMVVRKLKTETLNGVSGTSNIEGKVTRVGASERGERMSFKR
jgi:hypothetical protein